MPATVELPLVVHLVYCLDFGGLETLLVECINRMPAERYRHAIVCLTGHTEFSNKIAKPNVQIIDLNKPPGAAPSTHIKLWRLMRRLRPQILHTYNLAALEYNFTAALAGVPARVHAEHGRDAGDPYGLNRKHNLLRRLLVPFIDCYVPVSRDLTTWLVTTVGIPKRKTLLIDNGVDTERFHPLPMQPSDSAPLLLPIIPRHWEQDDIIIGTVGRVQDVKNHAGLVDAFLRLCALLPDLKPRLRLAIVGNGPLYQTIRDKVNTAGLTDCVWLPGARSDIADMMRRFTVFALPSIAEGTPVTILEAMACGLPVVATRVGGIPEVVHDDKTGLLVPAGDIEGLAQALAAYCRNGARAAAHGAAGRERIERAYSVTATVAAYAGLYDALLQNTLPNREAIRSCAE